jgi:hypothetical protein
MAGIRCLKLDQKPDCVGIMIEAPCPRHRVPKRVLAGMAEGWMPDIVSEAERFGQILVEAQCTRYGAADLRDFKAVSQANTEMVSIRSNENLRLVAEAAEGDGMDDPVPVALEGVAGAARLA